MTLHTNIYFIFSMADEQNGAKLPENWAFFLIGKCFLSLDYDISVNTF